MLKLFSPVCAVKESSKCSIALNTEAFSTTEQWSLPVLFLHWNKYVSHLIADFKSCTFSAQHHWIPALMKTFPIFFCFLRALLTTLSTWILCLSTSHTISMDVSRKYVSLLYMWLTAMLLYTHVTHEWQTQIQTRSNKKSVTSLSVSVLSYVQPWPVVLLSSMWCLSVQCSLTSLVPHLSVSLCFDEKCHYVLK